MLSVEGSYGKIKLNIKEAIFVPIPHNPLPKLKSLISSKDRLVAIPAILPYTVHMKNPNNAKIAVVARTFDLSSVSDGTKNMFM